VDNTAKELDNLLGPLYSTDIRENLHELGVKISERMGSLAPYKERAAAKLAKYGREIVDFAYETKDFVILSAKYTLPGATAYLEYKTTGNLRDSVLAEVVTGFLPSAIGGMFGIIGFVEGMPPLGIAGIAAFPYVTIKFTLSSVFVSSNRKEKFRRKRN